MRLIGYRIHLHLHESHRGNRRKFLPGNRQKARKKSFHFPALSLFLPVPSPVQVPKAAAHLNLLPVFSLFAVQKEPRRQCARTTKAATPASTCTKLSPTPRTNARQPRTSGSGDAFSGFFCAATCFNALGCCLRICKLILLMSNIFNRFDLISAISSLQPAFHSDSFFSTFPTSFLFRRGKLSFANGLFQQFIFGKSLLHRLQCFIPPESPCPNRSLTEDTSAFSSPVS